MKMTFEEWQAGKIENEKAQQAFVEAYGEPDVNFGAAIIYPDGGVIEKRKDGTYHLMMSIVEYESGILAELELKLWRAHSQYNCQD